MTTFTRFALLLCLSTALYAQESGSIFIVRHAEKQSDADDAPLSARGQARAECLARTLRDARIATVLHSQHVRTKQTAAPLLRDSHAAEVTLPAKDYEQIAQAVHKAVQTGNVLVVGHSNTIPTLLTTLGAPGTNVPDQAFDLLFIIDGQNPKRTSVLHFCTELPSGTSPAMKSMAK